MILHPLYLKHKGHRMRRLLELLEGNEVQLVFYCEVCEEYFGFTAPVERPE